MPNRKIRRGLIWVWAVYAHLMGTVVLALGLSGLLVWFFSKDGPIVDEVGEARVISGVVPIGGTLTYIHSVLRYQSCPGEWIVTLTSVTPKDAPPAVVTIQRPASLALAAAGLHESIEQSLKLPDSVFPGFWDYDLGISSKCPTKTRFDALVHFRFEVGDHEK